MALKLDIIHDERTFWSLRSEWNSLLEGSCANTVFLTWEWIATWWEVYGGGGLLYVMAARDDQGRLVGLAPFHLAPSSIPGLLSRDTLRFIGDGGDVTPEYLDIIAATGHEQEVAAVFANQMCNDPVVRIIDLRPVAERGTVRECVRRMLAENSGRMRCTQDSVCPVMPLPESTEAFLKSRSQNYRKKMREYERRCSRELHAVFRQSKTNDEVRRDMDSLASLHQRRWNGDSRAFRSADYIEFHHKLSRRLLERGWLRLFTIESSSTPVAVLYCFMYGRRYYYYQAGRDPDFTKHRVGLVIMHKAILEAIEEGATMFDFLRGTEEYKYRWASADVSNLRLVYWKSLGAQMKGTIANAIRQLRLSSR